MCVSGTTLSEAALALMVEDLAEHPAADVMRALAKCRRELHGRLGLAAILERLPNQPYGPEAAWAKAVAARLCDENVSVVIERAIFAAFPFAL